MSTSDQVRAILAATTRAYRSDPAYRGRDDLFAELDRLSWQLNQPIRIALAGTLKAGKSTLVNALVGETIAPTDATEATRIVTWFRHGPTPKVTAVGYDGRRTHLPIIRADGLSFDFGALDAAAVSVLDVEWPATELIGASIIDTPGTSSLNADVSQRTLALLVPDDGVPRVDAVVFLLRTLNAADIALLTQIGSLVGGSAGALGVILAAPFIASGRVVSRYFYGKITGRPTFVEHHARDRRREVGLSRTLTRWYRYLRLRLNADREQRSPVS